MNLDMRNWRDRAACRFLPYPDVMYPDPGKTREILAAKDICATCPVPRECEIEAQWEEEGQSARTRQGIRAGLTPKERYNRRKSAPPRPETHSYKLPTVSPVKTKAKPQSVETVVVTDGVL